MAYNLFELSSREDSEKGTSQNSKNRIMKKHLLLLSLAVLSLTGCKKYKNKEVYANVPVYMDYASFRESFYYEEGMPIQGSGNIFIYNQYIFLSEEDKGIHIIDNSTPAMPEIKGFMNIPGNTQMAVKDNYLYANSFIDLLVIDISVISQPTLVTRVLDVFEYATPAVNDQYPVADIYKDRGVVVGWKIEKTKDVSGFGNKWFVSDCEECEQTQMTTKSMSSLPTTLTGSMSKFAIYEDHLYAIDNDEIMSIDITQRTQPAMKSSRPTYKTCETLFEKDGYLYMGTTTGMVVYNVKSAPSEPSEVSEIEHVVACDPVFVQGHYAYVTLRTGNDCGGSVNELQVIDISNKYFPKVKERFSMSNPFGLAVDGTLLFVCDGEEGLRVYDNTNPLECGDNLMYTFPSIVARDIILNNGLAVVIAEHGIFQYDYSNPANLQFISALQF